jgi:hypothetical protein
MKKVLLASLFVLPFAVSANGSATTKIDRVEVSDTGFNIYSSGSEFGASNCAGGDNSTINSVISFARADFPNGYASLLSVAMAAHMGKKDVSMWYVGCQVSPWNDGNMPKPSTLVIR